MGFVYAQILLTKPKDEKLKPVEVQCLVDTGATYLCIPETVAIQLKVIETISQQT